jgi:hypothetical protein
MRNKRLNDYTNYIIDETNGGKTMKKRQATNKKYFLGLVAAVAVFLVLFPWQVEAQTDDQLCALVGQADSGADYDKDGFTDFQECNGITLYDGTQFPGSNNGGPDRSLRLGPADPDLFVILVLANPSNIPPDPLEFVSNPVGAGGLGIVTHEIPLVHPERFVSPDSPQKAVRITENLHPEGIILGYANQGTPNGLDEAIIYTEHIKNHVKTVCEQEGSDSCTDVSGAVGPDQIISLYIKHTIAHEIGHMTNLAVEYNRRFGGYHYKAGSEVVLEQAVKYTAKKDKVTFYISTHYAEPSQQGVQLQ